MLIRLFFLCLPTFVLAEARIYHFTKRESWIDAQYRGSYYHSSLGTEGFIHFGSPAQVPAIYERHFKGLEDLVLLEVLPSRLTSQLKYEFSPRSKQFYPHLFGELNLDAVNEAYPVSSLGCFPQNGQCQPDIGIECCGWSDCEKDRFARFTCVVDPY